MSEKRFVSMPPPQRPSGERENRASPTNGSNRCSENHDALLLQGGVGCLLAVDRSILWFPIKGNVTARNLSRRSSSFLKWAVDTREPCLCSHSRTPKYFFIRQAETKTIPRRPSTCNQLRTIYTRTHVTEAPWGTTVSIAGYLYQVPQ